MIRTSLTRDNSKHIYFRDIEEAMDRALITLQLHKNKSKAIEYNFQMTPLDVTYYIDMDPDNDLMLREVKKRFME